MILAVGSSHWDLSTATVGEAVCFPWDANRVPYSLPVDWFAASLGPTTLARLLREPEIDQKNHQKRGQNQPRDHDDLDPQLANGRNVVVDI